MDVPKDHTSVPLMVEQQIETLKQDYLNFTYDLGQIQLRGKSLREHLKVTETLSYWWMTLIAEKNPLKTTSIYTVFKLRAFEKYYLKSGYRGIILCSDNWLLRKVLSQWCNRLGHPFEWVRNKNWLVHIDRGNISKKIPSPLRAGFRLFRLLFSRRKYLNSIKKLPSNGRQATIITYFPNIDMKKAEAGTFRSRYWGNLHEVLAKGTLSINWVWIYAYDGVCDFKKAVKYRAEFQLNETGNNRYYFLEEFLNTRTIGRALMLYCRLALKALTISSVTDQFRISNSLMDLWPVLAEDWYASISGSTAIDGCLKIAAFQTLASKLPRQQWGLYLYENQPWEKALIEAWRDRNIGKILGCQHSSVRFSLLNYFEHSKTYRLKDYGLPLPDMIVVNGQGAEGQLNEAAFPTDKLHVCEALRYNYLKKSDPGQTGPIGKQRCKRLLVITGILEDEVNRQMILLVKAAKQGALTGYDEVLVKPHPFRPVESILAKIHPPNELFRITNKPLSKIWPKVSAVYATHSTAAGLEAALLGIAVIIFLDEDSLNISSLYRWDGISHVGTAKDLASALQAPQKPGLNQNYFCLNDKLPKWKQLLGL
jgi:surface carbohydrate biosynthesis protein (TIGR04326 family)